MNRACICLAVALAGCTGTTGSGLVAFSARAAGSGNAAFDTGLGYHVTLSRAAFHLGAVYLNMSRPASGGAEEPCVLPGIYVGEVFGGVDLDLLSPAFVAFPTSGAGTQSHAVEAEVWLTGGDVNATDDPTHIFDAAGTATRGARSFPFSAAVTIGSNRKLPAPGPAMPGANPICRQRIVSPIPVDLTLQDGGRLDVQVDAAAVFNTVDFATLTPGSDGSYVIPDEPGGAGGALFKGVTSTAPYQFSYGARP